MKSKFVFFFCVIASFSYAQNGKITGAIKDKSGQPLEFVNVILYDVKDSSLVKAEISDAEGQFQMINIPSGEFYLSGTFVGLESYYSSSFQLSSDENKNFEIEMMDITSDLTEVTVTAKKPLLELQADKTVFNVEGSINASGGDALNLLRKSPGVVIDNNDNIYMMGKSGVRIFIDGKPTPLTGSDLAQYLKNVPSEEIKSIEIIHTPGAKYEAEGNGGIINIVFRKSDKKGFNGSLSANSSIGKKWRNNSSFNGNFKQNKINGFVNLSGYQGEGWNKQDFLRQQFGAQYDQDGLGEGDWIGANYRIGLDFDVNEKNTFGIQINGTNSDGQWNQESNTLISTIGNPTIDSTLFAQSTNHWGSNNTNYNLNYSFDSGKGQTLSIDLDKGLFRNSGHEMQPNTYYLGEEKSTILHQSTIRTNTPTNIDIHTAKIDYTNNWNEMGIESGLKFSNVVTDNTFDFYNVVNNQDVINADLSNGFTYEEMVFAGYANLKQQVNDKINYSLGIRVEHTSSNGILTTYDTEQNGTETKLEYTDLFPSLGLSYVINPKNSINFNFSRRLNRPDYQRLNPFQSRLDEITYEQGNEKLTPEYSNSFSLTHTFNYSLNTTINYTKTVDLITRFTGTRDEEDRQNEAFITFDNLDEQHAYSINIAAPLPITDWWSSYSSVTGVYTKNKGTVMENVIDVDISSLNIYSQQTFKIGNTLSAELSGFYNSPTLWGGTFRMEDMYNIDLGLQKSFLNDQLKVKLYGQDIFRSNGWKGTSDFDNLVMQASGRWDSYRIGLNVSYNFGNEKIKVRKRNTGLEEESRRVGGEGDGN